jgi:hypothetical protein
MYTASQSALKNRVDRQAREARAVQAMDAPEPRLKMSSPTVRGERPWEPDGGRLGNRLFDHLLRLPLSYFETRPTG